MKEKLTNICMYVIIISAVMCKTTYSINNKVSEKKGQIVDQVGDFWELSFYKTDSNSGLVINLVLINKNIIIWITNVWHLFRHICLQDDIFV